MRAGPTGEGRAALEAGDPAAAAAKLRVALAQWRGPALADVSGLDFAQAEAGRLEELRLAAMMERIDADLALGRGPELVAELEPLVAEHPLQERLRGQLMLALYRAGRQADALAVIAGRVSCWRRSSVWNRAGPSAISSGGSSSTIRRSSRKRRDRWR